MIVMHQFSVSSWRASIRGQRAATHFWKVTGSLKVKQLGLLGLCSLGHVGLTLVTVAEP